MSNRGLACSPASGRRAAQAGRAGKMRVDPAQTLRSALEPEGALTAPSQPLAASHASENHRPIRWIRDRPAVEERGHTRADNRKNSDPRQWNPLPTQAPSNAPFSEADAIANMPFAAQQECKLQMFCNTITRMRASWSSVRPCALQHERRPDASQPQKTCIDWIWGHRTNRDEARVIRQQRGFSGPKPRTPEAPPPGMTARIAAARAIAEAVTAARPIEERLAADLSLRDPRVDPRDRALARSIATVSLRRLGTIRKALGQRLEKGMPRRSGALEWTLVAGAAQLLFMETPDHAAVDLAVRAARADAASAPFAGLANAVLRSVARDRDAILAASDPLDDDTPPWLAARWRATYGDDAARAIAAAHRCEPTLDLSVKSDPRQWAERLGGIVLI